jgi:hypothetical protein
LRVFHGIGVGVGVAVGVGEAVGTGVAVGAEVATGGVVAVGAEVATGAVVAVRAAVDEADVVGDTLADGRRSADDDAGEGVTGPLQPTAMTAMTMPRINGLWAMSRRSIGADRQHVYPPNGDGSLAEGPTLVRRLGIEAIRLLATVSGAAEP